MTLNDINKAFLEKFCKATDDNINPFFTDAKDQYDDDDDHNEYYESLTGTSVGHSTTVVTPDNFYNIVMHVLLSACYNRKILTDNYYNTWVMPTATVIDRYNYKDNKFIVRVPVEPVHDLMYVTLVDARSARLNDGYQNIVMGEKIKEYMVESIFLSTYSKFIAEHHDALATTNKKHMSQHLRVTSYYRRHNCLTKFHNTEQDTIKHEAANDLGPPMISWVISATILFSKVCQTDLPPPNVFQVIRFVNEVIDGTIPADNEHISTAMQLWNQLESMYSDGVAHYEQ